MDVALDLAKLASEVRKLRDYYKAIVVRLQSQRIAYRLDFEPKTELHIYLEWKLAKQRAPVPHATGVTCSQEGIA